MIKHYFRKLVPQAWAQKFQKSDGSYLFQPGLVGKKDSIAANLPVFRAPPSLELYERSELNERYTMCFARSLEELREAQRLRHSVFTQEYQATISSRIPGVDEDLFDAYCDHLVVRDQQSQEVVGTYRILDPHQAKRLKGYYSETEFFITRLNDLRGSMVELGRSVSIPITEMAVSLCCYGRELLGTCSTLGIPTSLDAQALVCATAVVQQQAYGTCLNARPLRQASLWGSLGIPCHLSDSNASPM